MPSRHSRNGDTLWSRGLWRRLMHWLRGAPMEPQEIACARALIRAIDAGGMPLNPARINRIARDLGLEVSNKAPQEQTITRIRAALERCV